MHYKALLFVLLLFLPLFAEAGFTLNNLSTAKGADPSVSTSTGQGLTGFAPYSKRSISTDVQSNNEHTGLKNINTLSFLFAIGGLLSVGAIAVLWLTSVAGIVIAAALVLLFGMAALGTGYMAASKKSYTTLGIIGFIAGMVESLPVLLIGGFFVSIFEIGRFIFRRKDKQKAID